MQKLKVLTLGTDRSMFDPHSRSAQRMVYYGSEMESLDILVMGNHSQEKISLSHNVTVYPLSVRYKFFAFFAVMKKVRTLTRPDVISSQDPFELGLMSFFMARVLRTPLQVQVHTDFLSPHFYKKSIRNFFQAKVLAPFIIKRAQAVRVVSYRIQKSLADIIGDTPCVVLPVFHDKEKFSSSSAGEIFPKPFPVTLLTIARLESEKNIDTMLRALVEISLSFPDVGLVIVGDGSQKSDLKKLAQELGIQEKVIFTGQQSSVSPYLASADIYLQLSSYEGFGLALLEASSFGLPIVSTDIGLIGEVLAANHSVLVTPLEISEIVEKLSLLIQNKEMRERLGAEAKKAFQVWQATQTDYPKKYARSLEKACNF